MPQPALHPRRPLCGPRPLCHPRPLRGSHPLCGSRELRHSQVQHHTGNDPERAFRADEQLPHRQPGVVPANSTQLGDDFPGGECDFEAEHPIAHSAVAERLDTARIRRHHAADRRAAARAEIDACREPVRRQRLLQLRKGDAGLNGCRARRHTHLLDAVHAVQRENEFTELRCRAAGQAGPTALRHHPNARGRTQRQHARHLPGCSRPSHQ